VRVRSRYQLAFILSIGVVLVSVVYFFIGGSKPQEIVVAVTAVIGAIAIWFQMKRARDIAHGEFIMNLNQSFLSNDDVKTLYRKLIEGAEIDRGDQVAIVEYLSFFETIYLLLKQNVIDIRLIDDLFRFRFFTAVNNVYVQDLELIPDARFYRNIYALDDMWNEHLAKRGDSEESPSALRNRNPEYHTYAKRR
jgi:hypothetical protein